MSDSERCCPHCGGEGGFLQKFWTKYTQWVTFDGYAVNAESEDHKDLITKRCVDCGKDITRFVADLPLLDLS